MERPPRSHASFFYWAGYVLFSLIYRLVFRLKISGLGNVPADGGVILAANHESYADPPLVAVALPRPVHYVAKKELFDVPILGFLIRRTNAFPVRRLEHDITAFKTAKRLLMRGEPVLIFPEGTRRKNGHPLPPKAGVAMLAAKANVPIVPVGIWGAGFLWRLPRLRLRFGSPIEVKPDCRDYLGVARNIITEIEKLKHER